MNSLNSVFNFLSMKSRPHLDPNLEKDIPFLPRAELKVHIPRDGWYIVNLEGRTVEPSTVTLRTGHGWIQKAPTVDTLEQQQSGFVTFPTLLELSAGTHYFSWVLNKGRFSFDAVSMLAVLN